MRRNVAPRVPSEIADRVTVAIVPGAMAGERVSRARNRRNRSRVRNAANKANHHKSRNPLKPPQAAKVQNANVRAAAEEAAIEVTVRNAKHKPRAKHSLH